MHRRQQPPRLAPAIGIIVVALAVIVFVACGIGGVLVLALAGSLVGSYLAHRRVSTHLGGPYGRHCDHMD